MSLQFAYPALYRLVGSAGDEARRAATRAACEIARRRTRLEGPEIDRAVAALGARRYGETDERRDVRELAERLAREAPEGESWLWLQAMAARAYSFALLRQSLRAADDGIFYAIAAVRDDLSEIEPVVRALLTDDLAPSALGDGSPAQTD